MPQTSRCSLYLSPFLSSPARAETDERKPSGFVRNHASTEGISRDAYLGAAEKRASLDHGQRLEGSFEVGRLMLLNEYSRKLQMDCGPEIKPINGKAMGVAGNGTA